MVRACRAARLVDDVVVATSTLPGDDPVADLARELGAPVVRGSEDDVLSRYVQALDEQPADALVRITADCPFTDPAVIDTVVGAWLADPTLDYVSTVVVRTLPHGLDVELVTAEALRRVAATATDHHRIHVTSGIYTAPDEFAVMGLCFAPDTTDLRITLDTPRDLEALRAIVAERGTEIAERREIIALLRARPDLAAINADIAQKSLEAG
ncbi:spore coat protein [Phycicoccus sp. Soil803]|nr:spore coat protein [Phycicoccus sp. Soil803]